MVVGLGNPGPRYARTRHNVGFMAAGEFLARHGRGEEREEQGALVGRARWAGQPVLVARPQSFMNLSGGPVSKLCGRYGVAADDVVLIYDDSDLPLGALRVRPDGRSAGHRGVQSVMEALGTERIARVRLGIGRPDAGAAGLSDYVLDEFDESERETLDAMIGRSVDALQVLLKQGVKAAMDLYNQRPGGA
jgi:PTH1 family peptidyl-tRNA hydrolase